MNLPIKSDYCEINCAAPRVTWFGGQIVRNDIVFINVWVELSFSFVILWLFGPLHKIIWTFLRSVPIIEHQWITQLSEYALNLFQCQRGLCANYWDWFYISFHCLPSEIRWSGVACLDYNAGVYLSKIREAFGQLHVVAGRQNKNEDH